MNTNSEFRKVIGLWLIVAMTVVLLSLLACSANAQVSVIRAPLAGFGGITTCDNRNQIIVVVNSTAEPSELKYIAIHEDKHVEQMLAFQGGCLALCDKYRMDKNFRLQIEMEAYCEDFKARVEDGMPKENIINLATYLSSAFGNGLTPLEVLNLLPCGGRNGRHPKVLPDGTGYLFPQFPRP